MVSLTPSCSCPLFEIIICTYTVFKLKCVLILLLFQFLFIMRRRMAMNILDPESRASALATSSVLQTVYMYMFVYIYTKRFVHISFRRISSSNLAFSFYPYYSPCDPDSYTFFWLCLGFRMDTAGTTK